MLYKYKLPEIVVLFFFSVGKGAVHNLVEVPEEEMKLRRALGESYPFVCECILHTYSTDDRFFSYLSKLEPS